MTARNTPPPPPGTSPPQQGISAETLEMTRSRLRRVARLLDSGIAVPGTSWRVGIEALIGLIPGIGDVIGAVLGSYFVVEALRVRAPRGTVGRMVGNVLFDLLLGIVPVVGDIADFAFKSNERNLRLLDRHLDDRLGVVRVRPRRGGVATLLLITIAALAIGAVWLLARRALS